MPKIINIGIDLGTTNSAIVINNKGSFDVVKNDRHIDYTPSVFGYDPAGNPRVGELAYKKLFENPSLKDTKNYKAEIKRLMGTQETVYFESLKTSLTPEEISSEILKYLKESVHKKYPDFELGSAVITVPAHFSTLQSEATKRAGELAGFKYVVLLQEPIAAAISYGFSNAQSENWLVYDFGGGTFDVAVISLSDGILNVKSHNGDNYLGGKDLDWIIVENVIIPKILEKYEFTDLNRNNKKYIHILNRLKYLAEQAKKDLSINEKTTIFLEGAGEDEEGQEIEMNIDFSRASFEKIIKPLIQKTIELSKKTITESGLENSNIARVILVGGPTQIPAIRDALKQELGINIDSSVDPLTVVAKGACIYGASQIIPDSHAEKTEKDNNPSLVKLDIKYDPMTAEEEQLITGVVEAFKETDTNYYIQFQSEDGLYASPKIKLKNGKFVENITVQPNKSNMYFIYLSDDKGNILGTNPDNIQIIHGISVAGSPLPHSVGIALTKANFSVLEETMEFFFKKGNMLPLKKSSTFRTHRDLKKGDDINILPVKIYEGESINPERNTYICDLFIKGTDVLFDLPRGTEIEITLEINESRELKVGAYIPLIDKYIPGGKLRSDKDENVDPDRLLNDLETERKRFSRMSGVVNETEKNDVENELNQIETQIAEASTDLDTVKKSQHEFKKLQERMDKIEKENEMDALIKEFNDYLESIPELLEKIKTGSKEKYEAKIQRYRTEGNNNINAKDKELLKNTNNNLSDLQIEILSQDPSYWVYWLRHYQENRFKLNFSNPTQADILIQKGEDFINQGNVDGLQSVVRELWHLLPKEQQRVNNMSGLMK